MAGSSECCHGVVNSFAQPAKLKAQLSLPDQRQTPGMLATWGRDGLAMPIVLRSLGVGHSAARSAATGSSLEARIEGTRQATRATPAKRKAAAPKMTGSSGSTK